MRASTSPKVHLDDRSLLMSPKKVSSRAIYVVLLRTSSQTQPMAAITRKHQTPSCTATLLRQAWTSDGQRAPPPRSTMRRLLHRFAPAAGDACCGVYNAKRTSSHGALAAAK
jgi:hypothetical protein